MRKSPVPTRRPARMWQIRRILTRFSNCGGMSPIVVGLVGEAKLSSRNRKSDMNWFLFRIPLTRWEMMGSWQRALDARASLRWRPFGCAGHVSFCLLSAMEACCRECFWASHMWNIMKPQGDCLFPRRSAKTLSAGRAVECSRIILGCL